MLIHCNETFYDQHMNDGSLFWLQYPTVGRPEQKNAPANREIYLKAGEPVILIHGDNAGNEDSGEVSYVLTSHGPLWIQNWDLYAQPIDCEF